MDKMMRTIPIRNKLIGISGGFYWLRINHILEAPTNALKGGHNAKSSNRFM